MESAEPRKKPRQRRSQQTVEAILDATARVLIDEGYDKASTNRIAEVAGVSVGSLYQYFGSKEALIVELARIHGQEQLAEIMSGFSAVASGQADFEIAVRAVIRSIIRAHALDPELHIVLTSQLMHLKLAPVMDIQGRAVELVKMALEANRHRLRVQNLDMAAWMMVTCVEAIVHNALIDTKDLDDPSIEKELVDIVLRYLLSDSASTR